LAHDRAPLRLADHHRRAPFFLLPLIRDTPPVDGSPVYVTMRAYSGAIATASGFVLWIAVLRWLPAGTAASIYSPFLRSRW
jgi:drug/metabolite transporter (DMT)-like permease